MSTDSPPPPAEAPWTVGRMIDWTSQHLKKHGSETPRLDAEILLSHARRCPRIQLYANYTAIVTEPERAIMRELVKRRARAEPVAYLVGFREFYSLSFEVNAAVLVPRPETETLVVDLITLAEKASQPDILEIGTGSGCIAITTAVRVPTAQLTAVDISPAALEVARRNAVRHKVDARVQFLEGDLFSPLPAKSKFDFIVSNPPYVADAEMETLPPDVRLHEPHLALKAGPQGLSVLTPLIVGSPKYLKPDGWLLLEFSPEQQGAIQKLLEQTRVFEAIHFSKDGNGDIRTVRARLVG